MINSFERAERRRVDSWSKTDLIFGKYGSKLFFLGVPLKCCVFRCISLREDAAATAHAFR